MLGKWLGADRLLTMLSEASIELPLMADAPTVVSSVAVTTIRAVEVRVAVCVWGGAELLAVTKIVVVVMRVKNGMGDEAGMEDTELSGSRMDAAEEADTVKSCTVTVRVMIGGTIVPQPVAVLLTMLALVLGTALVLSAMVVDGVAVRVIVVPLIRVVVV